MLLFVWRKIFFLLFFQAKSSASTSDKSPMVPNYLRHPQLNYKVETEGHAGEVTEQQQHHQQQQQHPPNGDHHYSSKELQSMQQQMRPPRKVMNILKVTLTGEDFFFRKK